MKTFSLGLTNFLNTATNYNRADLFAITCGYPQNMLGNSQDFEKATWAGSSSGASNPVVTPDNQVDPNGGNSADTIVFAATGAGQYSGIIQVLTGALPTINYTFSIWLKAATAQAILLILEAEPFTLGSASLTANVTTSWQRFSVTFSLPNTNTGIDVQLRNPASSAAQTIYCWGAQLEGAASIGVYVPTLATGRGPLGPRSPIIFATSSQFDITYQGVVFYASKNGSWERGKITSEASFDLRSNEMTLTVISSPHSVFFPNTTATYMAAAQLGLFDAAFVQVWTAYWPTGQNPNPFVTSWGVETKYAGYIKPNGSITRSKIEFAVADALYLLNLPVPKHVIQASCRHTLYDLDEFNLYGTRTNCTIVPALGVNGAGATVATGSTAQLLLTVSSLGQAPPYFSQGYAVFLTGQNAGLTFYIKQQNSTTSLLLGSKVPLPLAIGDTFAAYAGCDKSMATCSAKFSNLIHFSGQPFVPNPEVAI
jgi:hypothetical protein